MRVAQVNLQRDWGGAEKHVSLLSKGLKDSGHHIAICCDPRGALARDTAPRNIEVLSVRALNQLDLIGAVRLAARLSAFHPDIIHVHTPRDFLCGFLATRLLSGSALVITRHMLLPLKPMIRRIFRSAAIVCCLSDGIQTLLLQQGVPSARLRRVRSGIEVGQFDSETARMRRPSTRKSWSIEPHAVAVGLVGRMVKGKGHMELLAAAAAIKARPTRVDRVNPDEITLVFIGDGPERACLELAARDLGLKDSTRFLGFCNDIPAVMAALDILALPSHSEVLPLAIMEAMSAGLPIIATAVGGTAELVDDGITGILVPPNVGDALAEALVSLSEDPILRVRMGQVGLSRARRDFTLEAMIADTLHAYGSIV